MTCVLNFQTNPCTILKSKIPQSMHFFSFQFLTLCSPRICSNPPLSSCPWVVQMSSLSSLFPVPFLTSPQLFYAYQSCFFFPVPFLLIPPFLPTEISPCDLCFSDSVPVLVVCLVFVFEIFLFFRFIG